MVDVKISLIEFHPHGGEVGGAGADEFGIGALRGAAEGIERSVALAARHIDHGVPKAESLALPNEQIELDPCRGADGIPVGEAAVDELKCGRFIAGVRRVAIVGGDAEPHVGRELPRMVHSGIPSNLPPHARGDASPDMPREAGSRHQVSGASIIRDLDRDRGRSGGTHQIVINVHQASSSALAGSDIRQRGISMKNGLGKDEPGQEGSIKAGKFHRDWL